MKEITYKKWFDAFEFIKNTEPLEFDIYVQLKMIGGLANENNKSKSCKTSGFNRRKNSRRYFVQKSYRW